MRKSDEEEGPVEEEESEAPWMSEAELLVLLGNEGEKRQWRKEYIGKFISEEEEEEERWPLKLARTYFYRCDLYDRQMCSGTSPRTGEPVPLTWDEHCLINRNASQVITDLVEHYGISRRDLYRAINEYGERF